MELGIVYPSRNVSHKMGKTVPKNLTAYFGLYNFFDILSKFEKGRFFNGHPLLYIIFTLYKQINSNGVENWNIL